MGWKFKLRAFVLRRNHASSHFYTELNTVWPPQSRVHRSSPPCRKPLIVENEHKCSSSARIKVSSLSAFKLSFYRSLLCLTWSSEEHYGAPPRRACCRWPAKPSLEIWDVPWSSTSCSGTNLFESFRLVHMLFTNEATFLTISCSFFN